MASITFNLYDNWRKALADPSSGAVSGTLKVAIVTSAYTPNQNTHDFWDDVSANQVSGSNYTAGGNALATVTTTMDGSGNVTVDADDPSVWTQHASGFTNGRRYIVYYDTGTGSTSRLVGYSADAGADFGNVAGDLTLTLNASGLYTSAR